MILKWKNGMKKHATVNVDILTDHLNLVQHDLSKLKKVYLHKQLLNTKAMLLLKPI